MIIKAPPGRKDNKHGFRDLVLYIANVNQKNHADEKTLFTGTRNLGSKSPAESILEMQAVAAQNIRVKNPVFHVVLSWRQGEIPTRRQVEECVELYLRGTGIENCQAFYGLHQNTDNLHLHIAINRVHPETYRAVQVAGGWWKKAHERIAREIEFAHKWEIEQSGRYEVHDGEILEKLAEGNERALPSKARDFENLYAEKSALRVAKERAVSIFKQGSSWGEIQENLSKIGMRMERKGSGLLVWVGDTPVKASSINQQFGFGKLKKRLGEYNAVGLDLPLVPIAPEPLRNTPSVREYLAAKDAHANWKKSLLEIERQKREKEWIGLKERQAADRRRMYLSLPSWKGRGALLNAMRQVQAGEHRSERNELKIFQKKRREEILLELKHGKNFPDFKTWLRNNGREKEAEVWRYRDSIPGVLGGDRDFIQPATVATHDLTAQAMDLKGRKCVGYLKNTRLALIDADRRIDIIQWRDRQNVLVSMKLAHQKWGSCSVHGSEAFVRLCIKIAAEEDIELRNYQKELKEARAEIEKGKIEREKTQTLERVAELASAFAIYHGAIAADRYRVTMVEKCGEGYRSSILGKEAGIAAAGFTAAEIIAKLPMLSKLDDRGGDLFFMPVSDKVHHILITDLSAEKLQQLRVNGYVPALVLESSPEKYQAVINIPKINAEHDKEVSAKLVKYLNTSYGNPKITGGEHPHRMPAAHDHKQRHRVRITQSDGGICPLTSTHAMQLYAEAHKNTRKINRKLERRPAARSTAAGDTLSAYYAHTKNILSYFKNPNWNQVDSMAALRLYATGHDVTSIKNAIEIGARQIRPEEMRDTHKWADYAVRTVKYVESGRGQQKLRQLEPKFAGYWHYLEGRKLRDQSKERGIGR